MTPSKSLLTRLEAKRDERAEEYGGALKHVIGADLPTADYKAGANEFIPMIVELANTLQAIDQSDSFYSTRQCDVAAEALVKLNEWLGGECICGEINARHCQVHQEGEHE